MTEPREIATTSEAVTEGLYHWHIANSAIGGHMSSSHAVVTAQDSILVDPVRLADEALAKLPRPTTILLTARCHQRAAWRYRREFGAEVWLPDDATPADEEPDRRYADGDTLPGGLQALRTPGPEWSHYSFFLPAGASVPPAAVVFCSDLVGELGEELTLIPPELHEDPDATRVSVGTLADLPFDILCLAHGRPIVDDPRAALRRLLD